MAVFQGQLKQKGGMVYEKSEDLGETRAWIWMCGVFDNFHDSICVY
ncbi:MAG: hypothetical protein US70_C0029G0005 [Parcubacteria group bacterium GW2011_GWD2_38_11]|nr:MAG: hypothetical protein US70_C0029G0005 [Parcubacteria group bacterium GW2011_GWD2_38_11]